MEELLAYLVVLIVATIVFFVIDCAACGITLWGTIFMAFITFVSWKERK